MLQGPPRVPHPIAAPSLPLSPYLSLPSHPSNPISHRFLLSDVPMYSLLNVIVVNHQQATTQRTTSDQYMGVIWRELARPRDK